MSKRWWSVLLAVAALALTFGVAAWADQRARQNTPSCEERLARDESVVHTNHNWTGRDVVGLSEYQEAHWLADALGNPCSKAPGPTDWRYWAVLTLRPENVPRIRAAHTGWQPGTPDIPAKLRPFVPAQARWEVTTIAGQLQGKVYLDADRALLYFDLSSS